MPERYRTIVADPPWHYARRPQHNATGRFATVGSVRRPLAYPSMSVDEVCRLPVSGLIACDAHLYLWTTNRYLWAARQVAEAWGFEYSQLLVWAKTPRGKGPGGAFAQNAEYVLFCRRGSLPYVEKQDGVWFNWKRTSAHSVKPEAFQDLVERVSPGPYLELFARRKRLGWDAWGNEVDSDIEMEAA